MDTVQLLEVGAYLSFILGAAFAVWQLYELRRDRRTQLVLNMMEVVSSAAVQEEYRKIMDNEFSNAKAAEEKCGLVNLIITGNYYDMLGYLLRRKLVDRRTVLDNMQIAAPWDKMKPWIFSESMRGSDPFVYEHFEFAANLERAYKAKKRRKGV